MERIFWHTPEPIKAVRVNSARTLKRVMGKIKE
jgi:hypothetical protein